MVFYRSTCRNKDVGRMSVLWFICRDAVVLLSVYGDSFTCDPPFISVLFTQTFKNPTHKTGELLLISEMKTLQRTEISIV